MLHLCLGSVAELAGKLHPLSGNQLSTSGSRKSASSRRLTGGSFTLTAASGIGADAALMVLSWVEGATSSCRTWRDEALFVEMSRGRRCGGRSFGFWGRDADGMVESGGRAAGGGKREGSEDMLMGGGGGLRFIDSDEGGRRESGGSLSCGWPCAILIDEAVLLAEDTLLIATEDEAASEFSPLFSFDSIKRSPT